MSKTMLTEEQNEDFMALWEQAITLSDPNRREAMEEERTRILGDAMVPDARTVRSVLASLARNANRETDEGRELAHAAKRQIAHLTSRRTVREMARDSQCEQV